MVLKYSVNLTSNEISILLDSINQGYDIFNISSSFYNDICIIYTSYTNTDMTLNYRIKYLYYNLCGNNCVYNGFDITTSTVKCNCSSILYYYYYYYDSSSSDDDDDSNNNSSNNNNSFSFKKFWKNFKNLFKNSNFKVVKCYKLLILLYVFKYNYGCWIMIGILFFIYCVLFILLFISFHRFLLL